MKQGEDKIFLINYYFFHGLRPLLKRFKELSKINYKNERNFLKCYDLLKNRNLSGFKSFLMTNFNIYSEKVDGLIKELIKPQEVIE